MRINNLPLLKQKVENSFGTKIFSFKECVDLNEDIFKKTGSLISVNTLRRFFGLVKSDHLPSFTTLNVLSKYCGFESFSQLLSSNEIQDDTEVDSILLSYIVSLFKETMVTTVDDPTYLDLVRVTIQFLNQYPHLVDTFQKEIAKTKNGQDFYYEQFVNLDKLSGYYGDGLYHYLSQKKTNEAQIFGYGLLALRYWLTKEHELFNEHCKKIETFQVENSMHPFVTGRYWGIKVLSSYQRHQELSLVLKETRIFYKATLKRKNKYSFPYFEYSFLLPLILTRQWQEAFYYIEKGVNKEKNISTTFIHRQLFQYFFLFKAIALTAMGQTNEALDTYSKIDTNEFFFVSKQFFSILYMDLGRNLKQVVGQEQKIENLVKEMGLTRFFELLNYSS